MHKTMHNSKTSHRHDDVARFAGGDDSEPHAPVGRIDPVMVKLLKLLSRETQQFRELLAEELSVQWRDKHRYPIRSGA
jgi:hypothetical protein